MNFLDTTGQHTAKANRFGVQATNVVDPAAWLAFLDSVDHADTRNLRDQDLVRIVRLRLLTDSGFPWWDISYCYGQLRDGRFVHVNLGHGQLRKANGGYKANLIEIFKEAGRFAKGMGVFDDGVISTLR